MEFNWVVVADAAVQALAPVILALIAWAGVSLRKLIAEKVKNESVSAILQRLNAAAFKAVIKTEQRVAKQFREAAADGKLTPEEKKLLQKEALAEFKSYLGAKGLTEATKVLGFNSPNDLDTVLEAELEDAFTRMKQQDALGAELF